MKKIVSFALSLFFSCCAMAGVINPPFATTNVWSGANSFVPANKDFIASPTGTGTVTINPATAGNINNMNIGATTPGTGAFSALTVGGQSVGTLGGANTWTVNNVFSASVGIGTSANAATALQINKSITGNATVSVINLNASIQSDVTAMATYNNVTASTAAASFTLPTLNHYRASQGTIGAGSTVTNQYGFYVASSLVGATNNYGFSSNIPSGSNRWNFHAPGTAANHFQGTTLIGTTTDNGADKLQVNGSIGISGKIRSTGTAPTLSNGASDCGTSPTISGTDTAGIVTVGSGTNGGKCTVTFAAAYANTPVCIAENNSSATNRARAANATTTKIEITGTLTAGDTLVYHCIGRF